MTKLAYQLLKKNLNLETSCTWFGADARDDFFPDPFHYADVLASSSEYLEFRKNRLLQLDSVPDWREAVPKKNLLLRDAVCMNSLHRVLYLSVLRHLLPKLDAKLSKSAYAFRSSSPNDVDAYPFSQPMERWKLFVNDFRAASLEPDVGAVVITDIAAFFDHIDCERLCMSSASLLGDSKDDVDSAVIELLRQLLGLWSVQGYGIPQNFDPSSFLGNLYLHPIDVEMSSQFRYFRYVDDIRIVAGTVDEAILALHTLQKAMAPYRLFLASDKTRIIKADTPEFKQLVDVTDDKIISEVEQVISSGNCVEIKGAVEKMFQRLELHASKDGDDRKFRAYSNRLLDAADYADLGESIYDYLVDFVIPRLRQNPERSDYWVRILANRPNQKVVDALKDLLIYQPSVFHWQRFQLWRLSLYCSKPLDPVLLHRAIKDGSDHASEAVAAQAIVCVGKHGDNAQRELLFSHFTSLRSYPVQRAVLIALQELPEGLRDHLYTQALKINSDHKELVDCLQKLKSPWYGESYRDKKFCKETPVEPEPKVLQGVGLVDGELVHFALLGSDLDYDQSEHTGY